LHIRNAQIETKNPFLANFSLPTTLENIVFTNFHIQSAEIRFSLSAERFLFRHIKIIFSADILPQSSGKNGIFLPKSILFAPFHAELKV